MLLKQLKILPAVTIIFLFSFAASAQDEESIKTKNHLLYYHSFAQSKPTPAYTKLTYYRPNNQLMSWPNYPLTAAQIEQRDKQWEQENKLTNKIAKDIIASFLSKKKKVAVIPKF